MKEKADSKPEKYFFIVCLIGWLFVRGGLEFFPEPTTKESAIIGIAVITLANVLLFTALAMIIGFVGKWLWHSIKK